MVQGSLGVTFSERNRIGEPVMAHKSVTPAAVLDIRDKNAYA